MQRSRALLLGILVVASTVMTLAAAVTGWLQVRKTQVVQADRLEWKDSIAHTALGLERAVLQFRGRLATTLAGGPDASGGEDLQTRYDVLVSRIQLLTTTQGADKLAESAAFQELVPRLNAWTQKADAIVQRRPLPVAQAQALMADLDDMAPLVQSTTRAAASLTADLIDEQFNALQKQAILIGSLAALQLLILVMAGLALRDWQREQLRARLRLEHLAGELGDAKRDAEAAARAKSQFLANMSHELRTPFQGVLGMLQLLDRSALDAAQRELVATAHGSATHLLSILNEILDFSAIEAGKATLNEAVLDLHRLCREVEASMRVAADERGLAFSVRVACAAPARVVGDVTRIKQILFNLLNNAIKFTPRGEVRLEVSGRLQADGRWHLRFEVADTGIGMDDALLARLFRRFEPGDGSLTRRFNGAGLGLEISRGLARLMGGDLGVTSRPGEGSRFVLTLALPQPVPAAAHEEAAPAGLPAPGGHRRLRVLVADDHPINRRYLALVLEALSQEAHFCANGQEALEAVATGAFDAVLMDIHMPVMDGLQATQEIRALGGRFATLPIIALSADVLAGSRERARAAGCDDFLTKPVQMEGLAALLQGLGTGRSASASVASGAAPASDGTARTALGLAPQRDSSCRFAQVAARLPTDRLRELMQMFFDDEAGTLQALRSTLGAGDAQGLAIAAHTCKGSARLLGLDAVAEVAERAEAWARHPAGDEVARSLVRDLEDALASTRCAWARWLQAHAAA